MKDIRLGAVGTGAIVREFLTAVAGTEGIEARAVCSRSTQRGSALAAEFGIKTVYTDLDALLSDREIGAVYIASPNAFHFPQAKAALLAGKSVVLEKPFCTHLADAQELLALARERGLFLFEAYSPAYAPNFSILQRELPKIGQLRVVLANYSQYSRRYDSFLAGETPYVFDPAYGGGALMDINYYNLAMNVLLFGPPRAVAYHPNLQRGIDTSGVLVLDYEDFVSTSTGAKDTWGDNFFQIEGEKGYIRAKNGAAYLSAIRVVTKDADETFDEQEDARRLFYEVREMTRLMLGGTPKQAYMRMEPVLTAVSVAERAVAQGPAIPRCAQPNQGL